MSASIKVGFSEVSIDSPSSDAYTSTVSGLPYGTVLDYRTDGQAGCQAAKDALWALYRTEQSALNGLQAELFSDAFTGCRRTLAGVIRRKAVTVAALWVVVQLDIDPEEAPEWNNAPTWEPC